jgi:hypothetical protein
MNSLLVLNATEFNHSISPFSKMLSDASVTLKHQNSPSVSIYIQRPLTSFINKPILELPLTEENIAAKCKFFIQSNSTINTENLHLLAAKLRRNQ